MYGDSVSSIRSVLFYFFLRVWCMSCRHRTLGGNNGEEEEIWERGTWWGREDSVYVVLHCCKFNLPTLHSSSESAKDSFPSRWKTGSGKHVLLWCCLSVLCALELLFLGLGDGRLPLCSLPFGNRARLNLHFQCPWMSKAIQDYGRLC